MRLAPRTPYPPRPPCAPAGGFVSM
jgi:hypothetical protein